MFDALKQFFKELSAGEEADEQFGVDDHRLAAAALLVHVISIDGVAEQSEKDKLKTVLMRRYELSEADTSELIEEAQKRDLEAVDLYGFTNVLKRALDDDGRARVIEMMWEIVYADGIVHEFEDNLVWRVAELLGISARDRIRLRKRIEAGREAGT